MAGKKKSGYDGKIAGLYDLEETIGHGHFAVVKLAKHVFTGEKVAVKVIDKQKLDEVSKSHLFQEVRCMKLVQHPHVVRLYEVIDTQTKLYLILELGDGDMYDYIMKHDAGLDETLAKKYFRQVVEAILYCHRLHVVHRDLKPENVVFFNKLGIVKLTDFGFSNVFAPGKKLETSCGSLAYSAPEILLGDSYDPPAVDVWSLGVILFMLVAGRAPFQEANDSETLTMIMDCKYQIPAYVSDACQELISKMLVREPSDRISLEEIEQDLWLASDVRTDDHMSVNLPLLSREHVSEDDHTYVVQKMVDGKICTREEIFQSLEHDAYDHVAATYYLLMERRLRKLQQHEAAVAQANLWKQPTSSNIMVSSKPHLEPLMLSPRKNVDTQKAKTSPTRKPKLSRIINPPMERVCKQAKVLSTNHGQGPDFMNSITTSSAVVRQGRQTRQQNSVYLSNAQNKTVITKKALVFSYSTELRLHQKTKSAPLVSSHTGTLRMSEKKKLQPSTKRAVHPGPYMESTNSQCILPIEHRKEKKKNTGTKKTKTSPLHNPNLSNIKTHPRTRDSKQACALFVSPGREQNSIKRKARHVHQGSPKKLRQNSVSFRRAPNNTDMLANSTSFISCRTRKRFQQRSNSAPHLLSPCRVHKMFEKIERGPSDAKMAVPCPFWEISYAQEPNPFLRDHPTWRMFHRDDMENSNKKLKAKKAKTSPIHYPNQSHTVIPPWTRNSKQSKLPFVRFGRGQDLIKSIPASTTSVPQGIQKIQKQNSLPFRRSQNSILLRRTPTFDCSKPKLKQRPQSVTLVCSHVKIPRMSEKQKLDPSETKNTVLPCPYFESDRAQITGPTTNTLNAECVPPAEHRKEKIWKRVAFTPNSPTSLDYSDYDHPLQRAQTTSSEHSESSSLVQSLVSPPGTHPSPASSSPKMTYLSPEAIFAAVRKCSLILEEAQIGGGGVDFEMDSVGMKPSRSLEFLDDRTCELSASAGQELGLSPTSGCGGAESVKPPRPLRSVCSSPQLLNQIHEENESENDDDFDSSKLTARNGRYARCRMPSPELLKKFDNMRRLKGTGQRGVSCSSSDASDTEDTEGRSKIDTLNYKLTHRRDSSDRSSDSDGANEGHSNSSGNCMGNRGQGSNPSHGSSSRGGSGRGEGQGSSGSKSGKSHSKQQCVHNSDSTSCCDYPFEVLQTENRLVSQQYTCLPGADVKAEKSGQNSRHKSNAIVTDKGNQLVQQPTVNGKSGKEDLGIPERDLGMSEQSSELAARSRIVSAVSTSAVTSGNRSAGTNNNTTTALNNNNNVNSRTPGLTTAAVTSSATTHCTAQYNGQYQPQGKDSNPLSGQSVEFSEISAFCDCLKDDKTKVSSVCSGDCGLPSPSCQSPRRAQTKQNGVTSTFCKVGPHTPVVQVDSKCCSVV